MEIDEVKKLLEAQRDDSNRAFAMKIIPGADNILGLKTPAIRALAKRIIRECDWRLYLAQTEDVYYEQTTIRALIIATAKMPIEERAVLIADFVPTITNWAVCDTFCCQLKAADSEQRLFWNLIQPYFDSPRPFEVRFGVVMMISHFINAEYVDGVLAQLDAIRSDEYYVQMAVAWALSVCYVKFPQKTQQLMEHSRLDDFTFNKAIQKCIESFRIDAQTKVSLRAMRRK